MMSPDQRIDGIDSLVEKEYSGLVLDRVLIFAEPGSLQYYPNECAFATGDGLFRIVQARELSLIDRLLELKIQFV